MLLWGQDSGAESVGVSFHAQTWVVAEHADRSHSGAVLPKMAEIEWSVFERQCLGQRIPSKDKLAEVAASWSGDRNDRAVRVNWRFGVVEARERLARLYPKLDNQ